MEETLAEKFSKDTYSFHFNENGLNYFKTTNRNMSQIYHFVREARWTHLQTLITLYILQHKQEEKFDFSKLDLVQNIHINDFETYVTKKVQYGLREKRKCRGGTRYPKFMNKTVNTNLSKVVPYFLELPCLLADSTENGCKWKEKYMMEKKENESLQKTVQMSETGSGEIYSTVSECVLLPAVDRPMCGDDSSLQTAVQTDSQIQLLPRARQTRDSVIQCCGVMRKEEYSQCGGKDRFPNNCVMYGPLLEEILPAVAKFDDLAVTPFCDADDTVEFVEITRREWFNYPVAGFSPAKLIVFENGEMEMCIMFCKPKKFFVSMNLHEKGIFRSQLRRLSKQSGSIWCSLISDDSEIKASGNAFVKYTYPMLCYKSVHCNGLFKRNIYANYIHNLSDVDSVSQCHVCLMLLKKSFKSKKRKRSNASIPSRKIILSSLNRDRNNSDENVNSAFSLVEVSNQSEVADQPESDVPFEDSVDEVQEVVIKSELESISTFEELNLCPQLHLGIESMGMNTPSEVQRIALPVLMDTDLPQNIIVQSPPGTGKTSMFLLAMLSKILCLSPTYELAVYMGELAKKMAKFRPDIKFKSESQTSSSSLPSTTSIDDHIIITNITKLEWYRRFMIDMQKIKICVFDDVEFMISKNKNVVQTILEVVNNLSPMCQILMLSSFYTETLLDNLENVISNPVIVSLRGSEYFPNVQQYYLMCDSDKEKKYAACVNICRGIKGGRIIIFCKNHEDAVIVCEHVNADGRSALHFAASTTSIQQRLSMIKQFEEKNNQVIVTSGLDIQGVPIVQASAVINFSIVKDPSRVRVDYENYLHRVGRIGHFGDNGIVINLTDSTHNLKFVQQLEEFSGLKIPKLSVKFSDSGKEA